MDLKKQRAEMSVTSFILALTCYLQYVAYTSKVRTKVDGIKSMTFPKVVLYTIIVLCLIVLVQGILNYRKLKKTVANTENTEVHEKKKFDIRILVTIGLILLYAVLWNVIGFTLSSILFVFVESMLLDHSKPWWHGLLIAVGYVIIVYLVFALGFKVSFPEPIFDVLMG